MHCCTETNCVTINNTKSMNYYVATITHKINSQHVTMLYVCPFLRIALFISISCISVSNDMHLQCKLPVSTTIPNCITVSRNQAKSLLGISIIYHCMIHKFFFGKWGISKIMNILGWLQIMWTEPLKLPIFLSNLFSLLSMTWRHLQVV